MARKWYPDQRIRSDPDGTNMTRVLNRCNLNGRVRGDGLGVSRALVWHQCDSLMRELAVASTLVDVS